MRRSIAMLAVLVSLGASSGCDPAYEAPCVRTRTESTIPSSFGGPRLVGSLHRSKAGAVASFAELELSDPSRGVVPPTVVAFELLSFDGRGALVARNRVLAPSRLRARRGSTSDVDVVSEEGATLFRWTETTTSTDPDGRVHQARALRLGYGGQGALDPAVACDDCVIAAAFASLGDSSVGLVRTVNDATMGVARRSWAAFRVDRSGRVEPIAVPWLVSFDATPKGSIGGLGASSTAEMRVDLQLDAEGRLVFTFGGHVWLLDRSLRPLAGPLALPSPDARAVWNRVGAVSVAWSTSPFEDGRTSDPVVPREVFTSSGSEKERVSRGRLVFAVDRRDDAIGVVFESAGRTMFAAVDPTGNKRGGDVMLRENGEPSSRTEYGSVEPAEEHLLLANGAGRYTSFALDAAGIVVSEVSCAP